MAHETHRFSSASSMLLLPQHTTYEYDECRCYSVNKQFVLLVAWQEIRLAQKRNKIKISAQLIGPRQQQSTVGCIIDF